MADNIDIAAIEQADQARYQAMVNADLAALAALLADDLSYTHSSALNENRAQYLASVASGRFRYLGVQRSDLEVRLLGDSAFMHGRAILHAVVDGTERQLDNRFLSVWTRRAGHWQMAAWASTPIPAKAVKEPDHAV